MFAYEREYGSLLPRRFSSDVLLRTVFFTIMAIEDGNRPDFIRSVERMAARFNLAKTTGIMQQMSDKPLSDVDSVKLSIPYIERMWGQYLVEFARSIEGVGGEAFRISRVTTRTTMKHCLSRSANTLAHFMVTIAVREL